MAAPQFKQLRRSYGFDEVAIVPGDVTINPDQTNIDFEVEDLTFSIPILASAMDAVTDVNFAILMNKLGGLAVLHLEGVQTRYDNPQEVLTEIAQAPDAEVTRLLQKVYSQPIKENLIGERIQAIKKAGAICAVSVVPANTKRFAPIVAEAQADILDVAQSLNCLPPHQSGSYYQGACCPGKHESTKGKCFVIWPSIQGFRCYHCDAKGDVIDLVKLARKVDFHAAIDWLADRYGMPRLATKEMSPDEKRQYLRRIGEQRIIFTILTEAARFYHQILIDHEEMKKHLREHYGLSEEIVHKINATDFSCAVVQVKIPRESFMFRCKLPCFLIDKMFLNIGFGAHMTCFFPSP